MYEELVARLRAGEYAREELSIILPKAADAIEELSRAQEQWITHERNALLKSVPKWIPDGRLGDLDALMARLEKYHPPLDIAMRELADAPTIVPAEEGDP